MSEGPNTGRQQPFQHTSQAMFGFIQGLIDQGSLSNMSANGKMDAIEAMQMGALNITDTEGLGAGGGADGAGFSPQAGGMSGQDIAQLNAINASR